MSGFTAMTPSVLLLLVGAACDRAATPAATATPTSCDPTGKWQLSFTKVPPEADAQEPFIPCKDPPITNATVVVTAAGKPGKGTWQGRAAEKLSVFDDAGTWDFTVFPSPPESHLSLVFTAKNGKVVEGQLIRQPKRDGNVVCTDIFTVRGVCE